MTTVEKKCALLCTLAMAVVAVLCLAPAGAEARDPKTFFHLRDRFHGLKESRSSVLRSYVSANGFWAQAMQFALAEEALSAGAAYVEGDFNGDGSVDQADYTTWADNYGRSDAAFAPLTSNGDGIVDQADYTTWADHYGQGSPNTNQRPTVAAGTDQTITLPTNSVSLAASVSDDGKPNPPGAVTVQWTKQSGPGTVTLGNATAVDTTATFSASGTYVLRLTASDSVLNAYDEVTIVVYPAPTVTVITPTAWGNVTSWQFANAFNAQPTWNGTAVTGGDTGYAEFWATWEGTSKVSYIDFGPNWAQVRIIQTWTKYIQWRAGAAHPYGELWWDDDIDVINDGVTEGILNFCTQTHTTAGGWIRDVDTTAHPVAARARYLMLKQPATPPSVADVSEISFVGYLSNVAPPNQAPSANAGADQFTYLPASAVNLDGTVSDDGLPNPQAGLTVTWSKTSGPGTVRFGNIHAVDTTATLSQEGNYVLRLTVSDGVLSSYNEMTVHVSPALPQLSMSEVKAFDYADLTLVDEVDCGNAQDSHALIESVAGVSQIQTILGRACRVLLNPLNAEPRYFAYRIGEGYNLQAGKGYVLVLEYPEDKPRSVIVLNRGCETNRTFHSGTTIGDALQPPYEQSRSTSIRFGLSQQYRTAEELFHLHDRYPGIQQPRDDEYPRDDFPDDGFLVIIAQYANEDCPESAGAAIARIALYEAPDMATYTQPLATLPAGLPKRHLFWREEMSDAVVNSAPYGVTDDINWYEYKARLQKFLGMNTFCRDLLEFGHNQGWNPAKYGEPGNAWFNMSTVNHRWEQTLCRLNEGGYGLDYLPYYEYSGGDGSMGMPLGKQKRALPLYGGTNYTNISWCEVTNVDCTDPATCTDAQRVLECTITDMASAGRPVSQDDPGNWLDKSTTGKWGYIDFGANWQNVRIAQTWTRSRQWRVAGAGTPYQAVYWHTSPTGFSGSTVPQGAIQETTLNFITQPQITGESDWTRDVNLPAQNALAPQRRYLALRAASTLREPSEFLVVGWIQGSGTDPRTIPVTAGSIDGHNLATMFDYQTTYDNNVSQFVGAWIRPRPSQIPISFADATLARFATEANGGVAVTRTDMQNSSTLRTDYYEWWNGKRHAFLNYLRDYLRAYVNEDAVILYTCDASESGLGLPSGHPLLVTDDVDTWSLLVANPLPYSTAMSEQLELDAMLAPRPNSYQNEAGHSAPIPDPANYQSTEGVMLTHTFNKLYTVSDPATWQLFTTQSGLAAIRHYCLNEDATRVGSAESILGYTDTDADPAGPYCMIGEARAMAYGDPFYIGYLSSNSFNRLFPGYVRDFNANYLALPAMTSSVVANAASDAEVVVRRIDTASNGTWLAIVNTSINEKQGVVIALPASGTVMDAVTGQTIQVTNGKITLDMWPARLVAVHIQ